MAKRRKKNIRKTHKGKGFTKKLGKATKINASGVAVSQSVKRGADIVEKEGYELV